MSEEKPSIEIFFSDDFKLRLRSLAKRYRRIFKSSTPLKLQDQTGDKYEGRNLRDRRPKLGNICDVN